jgi:hypothetical protein
MDARELMIKAVNDANVKNKWFEDKYEEMFQYALNFEKMTFLAKSSKINKPQYGGDFICVCRYNKKKKMLLWEYANPHTSELSRRRAKFVKDAYDRNHDLKWFGDVGLENIEPKMAYCLAAFCFSIRGGIYLAAIDDATFTTFIILNSFDAVREDVGYGR